MATYNADIRIGVVGKSSLNSLEAQLNRIGKQTKALNNALKIRSQRVKLNTAGAMSQLKRLNTELSKLGRTITVKVKAAGLEEAAKKQSTSIVATAGGGGGRSAAAPAAAAALAVQQAVSTEIIRQTKATENLARLQGLSNRLNAESAKKLEISRNYSEEIAKIRNRINSELTTEDRLQFGLTKSAQKQLDNTKKRLIEQEGYVDGAMGLNARLLKEQERLIANDGRRARTENQIADARNRNLRKQLEQTTAVYNKESAAFASLQDRKLKVARATSENITQVEQEQAAKREELARREARTQERLQRVRSGRARQAALQAASGGALRGGIASAATIPGISPLALGAGSGAALGGGIAGGVTGAAVAAAVQGTAALVAYGNAAAKAATETDLLRLALAGVVGGAEYADALEGINEITRDFNQEIGSTTQSFTKLAAATRANGLSAQETTDVYKGLAAANLALGGDAVKLEGILLATSQVFSKGKVQAEELRGQIGERLPGAFALFARSLGISTSQLDKALEQGEVSVEDFVNFTKFLFKEYEKDAGKIAKSPEAAAARLTSSLSLLQDSVGRLLKPVRQNFLETADFIVKQLTRVSNFLNRVVMKQQEDNIRLLKLARAGAINSNNFELAQEIQEKIDAARDVLNELKFGPQAAGQPLGRNAGGDTGETEADEKAAKRLAERQARQAKINDLLRIDKRLKDDLYQIELARDSFTETQLEKLKAEAVYLADVRKIEREVTDETQKQLALYNRAADLKLELLKLDNEELDRVKQTRAELTALVNDIANQGLVTEFEKVSDAVAEISPGMQAANQAGNELFRTFENLISATKNWTDVLADALKALSSVLIRFALGGLAGGDGRGLFSFLNGTLSPSTQTSLPGVLSNQTDFTGSLGNVGGGSIGFRARGGRVTGASPYVVGEQGAELFIPGKSGTIVPADVFNATRAAMSGGSEGGNSDAFDQNAVAIGTNSSITKEKAVTREMAMAGSTAVDVRYDATVINDVSYVSEEQFQAGLKAAVAQSKASMFRDLKNKPSARAGIGI